MHELEIRIGFHRAYNGFGPVFSGFRAGFGVRVMYAVAT